jgi:hypothetical protein
MSAILTNDIRSAAKPYLREKTNNKKWARGGQEPATHHCHKHIQPEDNCRKCLGRPQRRGPSKGNAKRYHDEQNKLSGQTATLARKAFRGEIVDAFDGPLALVSDASEEEEVADVNEAPQLVEFDYMYSYDQATGPRGGQDVLSQALTQAVKRFESKETDKLISNEYDVVDDKEMAEASTDEDNEYEFVDYEHLN